MGVKNNNFSFKNIKMLLTSLMKRKAKQRMPEAHPNDF